jgi:glutamate dehydrogenase (NAD(P)+)
MNSTAVNRVLEEANMKPSSLLPPEIDDPLLDSAAQLEESARALDLEDWIVHRLRHSDREMTVNLPLPRDTGALTCTAFRVQHLRAHGPCIGPVRLAPDAHLAQLRSVALDMTLQCALLDLPLGGSAGAIVCDPAQFTERELRHLVRHYLAALDLHNDIFAPSQFIAAWISARRHLQATALVARPAILGGLPDPAAAMAAGWSKLVSESCATRHQPLTTVSIQGFSAAAAALATLLHSSGVRIVGLADKSGGLFSEHGLDLAAVSAHTSQTGMLYGFSEADPVNNSEILESACDLLVLAAAERQLNAQNAARIQAPMVLEAVSGAVTPAAMSHLSSRGITVIPALLGVGPRTLAWFAEWQSGMRYEAPEQSATESLIRHRLADVLCRAQSSAALNRIPLPDACRRLALEKLAAVLRLLH